MSNNIEVLQIRLTTISQFHIDIMPFQLPLRVTQHSSTNTITQSEALLNFESSTYNYLLRHIFLDVKKSEL
jgi:hypothetical protein